MNNELEQLKQEYVLLKKKLVDMKIITSDKCVKCNDYIGEFSRLICNKCNDGLLPCVKCWTPTSSKNDFTCDKCI